MTAPSPHAPVTPEVVPGVLPVAMTKEAAVNFLGLGSTRTLDRRVKDPANGLRYIVDGKRRVVLTSDLLRYHARRMGQAEPAT